MTQKIIKVGNSFAVTIPHSFVDQVGFKAGDSVDVESDSEMRLMIVKPSGSSVETKITPEFKAWLTKFNKKYKKALQALANV